MLCIGRALCLFRSIYGLPGQRICCQYKGKFCIRRSSQSFRSIHGLGDGQRQCLIRSQLSVISKINLKLPSGRIPCKSGIKFISRRTCRILFFQTHGILQIAQPRRSRGQIQLAILHGSIALQHAAGALHYIPDCLCIFALSLYIAGSEIIGSFRVERRCGRLAGFICIQQGIFLYKIVGIAVSRGKCHQGITSITVVTAAVPVAVKIHRTVRITVLSNIVAAYLICYNAILINDSLLHPHCVQNTDGVCLIVCIRCHLSVDVQCNSVDTKRNGRSRNFHRKGLALDSRGIRSGLHSNLNLTDIMLPVNRTVDLTTKCISSNGSSVFRSLSYRICGAVKSLAAVEDCLDILNLHVRTNRIRICNIAVMHGIRTGYLGRYLRL